MGKVPVEEEIEIPAEFTISKIGELLEKFPDYVPLYDYRKKAFVLRKSDSA